MATHCLVCGSRLQQHCGLICAAGALSHEKSHAVHLIGAPEIRTATSSSPRNRSKYTRPSSPCRGGVWDRDYTRRCFAFTLGSTHFSIYSMFHACVHTHTHTHTAGNPIQPISVAFEFPCSVRKLRNSART